MSKKEFTPTENLILEVLIARARLGERLWTFSSDSLKQAETLASKGWIDVMHGVVENTYRASLTDKGRARFLSFKYDSPLKVEGAKKVRKEAKNLLERFGKNFWKEDF